MPSVVVINESAGVDDADVQAMLPAFAEQWNRDLTAVWDVQAAAFAFGPRSGPPAAGAWWVVLLDDPDQATALAYHDLTNEGLPLAKVFLGGLIAHGASVSVSASHEICEMAVDPWLDSAYQDPVGVFWAAEVCDPVEDDRYAYRIDDIWVSDFVTPAWFGQPPPSGRVGSGGLDLGRHAVAPFQIPAGGFAQRFQAREGWVQVTGERSRLGWRANMALRGSRRERRVRLSREPLKPSRRQWVA